MPFCASVSLSIKWRDFTCSLWFSLFQLSQSTVPWSFLYSSRLSIFQPFTTVQLSVSISASSTISCVSPSFCPLLVLSLCLTICHQVLPVRQFKKKSIPSFPGFHLHIITFQSEHLKPFLPYLRLISLFFSTFHMKEITKKQTKKSLDIILPSGKPRYYIIYH